ncbi:hypothetical protein U1Q18_007574 [Sarracenia purpurea var. burkii]
MRDISPPDGVLGEVSVRTDEVVDKPGGNVEEEVDVEECSEEGESTEGSVKEEDEEIDSDPGKNVDETGGDQNGKQGTLKKVSSDPNKLGTKCIADCLSANDMGYGYGDVEAKPALAGGSGIYASKVSNDSTRQHPKALSWANVHAAQNRGPPFVQSCCSAKIPALHHVSFSGVFPPASGAFAACLDPSRSQAALASKLNQAVEGFGMIG